MDKQFNAQYIDAEFEKIGARVKKPINVYLIGGCAMSFRGLKESTKDVDIVFKNERDFKIFSNALFGAQYWRPAIIQEEHKNLHATKMYENKDVFHLDLFLKRVIRKLALSKTMVLRAELFKTYGNLSVYLLSKEDVFLFKGLASEGRKRDLPDMEMLYPKLDWKIIEAELYTQKLSQELVELFFSRMKDFSDLYKLDVPIKKRK